MNKLLIAVDNAIRSFANNEEGAQVVEYALIIAVVSIALVVALRALTDGGGGLPNFIARVAACLSSAAGALACA